MSALSVFDARRPRPRCTRDRLLRLLLAITTAGFLHAAAAATIAVPNGDFSDPGNFGSIGGGVIGGAADDVPIGSGPWLGSYAGVLGLLAPPTLTIGDGAAEISGLAAANILGIFDNGGSFSQTLSQSFETGKRYTLSATVDAGGSIGLGLLGSGNFGLALGSGGVRLASTATAPPSLIHLQPIGGTTYQLTLMYDASADNGPIDVELFCEPQQLIGAELLPHVTFGAVTLDGTAINPVSGSIVAVDPSPQSATVGEPFPNALAVRVTDVDGDPVPGVTVTFSTPADGASAVLSSQTAVTGDDGGASVTATASTVAGSYVVSATVDGVDTPATFNLTNLAGPPASTVAAQGDGQSAPIDTPFPVPLVVAVADAYGNAVEGVEVTFAAPPDGASATLSATSVATDANGLAQVQATANDIVGSYEITASVDGVGTPATFALTNRVDEGTTIASGSGNHQSASTGGTFACALRVVVDDADGMPLAGYAVDFVAPDSGPSAMLYDGVTSGESLRVLTGADGAATVNAIANDIAGDYEVTATLVDSSAPAVVFNLANIEGLIFRSGFDEACTSLLP
ncbi:MAG TPA: Ig-like domain-containing protein [Rhodanobacteraceae bacterium]|nr:Ig-like domain-containing protein [Rhodanobacteraceae bacterium]